MSEQYFSIDTEIALNHWFLFYISLSPIVFWSLKALAIFALFKCTGNIYSAQFPCTCNANVFLHLSSCHYEYNLLPRNVKRKKESLHLHASNVKTRNHSLQTIKAKSVTVVHLTVKSRSCIALTNDTVFIHQLSFLFKWRQVLMTETLKIAMHPCNGCLETPGET